MTLSSSWAEKTPVATILSLPDTPEWMLPGTETKPTSHQHSSTLYEIVCNAQTMEWFVWILMEVTQKTTLNFYAQMQAGHTKPSINHLENVPECGIFL